MAKYDEAPVPRGTSRRWEVLMSDDEPLSHPGQARRTALEVRAEHRVLAGFGETELESMPLVPEGQRLARQAWYLDLHDPARADYVADGDEVVKGGQHVIARKEVSPVVWEELLRACDVVLGRQPPVRLRPAV